PPGGWPSLWSIGAVNWQPGGAATPARFPGLKGRTSCRSSGATAWGPSWAVGGIKLLGRGPGAANPLPGRAEVASLRARLPAGRQDAPGDSPVTRWRTLRPRPVRRASGPATSLGESPTGAFGPAGSRVLFSGRRG